MQPDPVDSTKMISVDDHGWDEQDQYESDKYKDRLLRLEKNLALLGKEERLDIHGELEQQLEGQRELEQLDWRHREWETEDGGLQELRREIELLHRRFLLQGFPPVAKFSGGDDTSNVFTQIRRKFHLSPKVDNQLEAKHKPIQMMSPYYMNFCDTSDGLNKSVVPKSSIARMIMTSDFFPAWTESESPDPGTFHIHKYSFGEWIRTSTKRSCSVLLPFDRPTNPRPGEKGFVLHSAYAKGNRARKNIFVISSTGNGGSSSEGTDSALTGGNNHHRETIASYNDMPEVILDNQAQVNCTGNFNVLSNLSIGSENVVLIAANGGEMETFMSGSVCLGNFELTDVHYCPDLGNRIIVSGSILDNDDYGYEFRQGKFTVKDLKNDTIVGEGHLVDGNYILEYLKISGDRTRVPQQPGLVTTVWNAVCSALHRLGLKY